MIFYYYLLGLNLYFYTSGTSSFFDKYGPSFISSFFGLGTALAAFILTNRATRNRDKEQKNERENDKLKYLASLLNGVLEEASVQKKFLEEEMITLNKEVLNIGPLKTGMFQDTERISNKLNLEPQFLAYINKFGPGRKETIDEYRVIISQVDFLYNLFQGLIEFHKQGMINDHERKLGYISLTAAFDKAYGEVVFLLEANPPIEDDKLLAKDMVRIFEKWQQMNGDRYNLRLNKDNFVEPLFERLKESFARTRGSIPELRKLLLSARDIMNEFPHLEQSNKIFRAELKDYLSKFSATIDKIKSDSIWLRNFLDAPIEK